MMGNRKGLVRIDRTLWETAKTDLDRLLIDKFDDFNIYASIEDPNVLILCAEFEEFDELSEGERIPEYRFTFHTGEDGNVTREKAERI